jgi:phenylpyruvate tautomerase PptA (4-oxalocrotonate tautomerase family)
MSWITCDMRFGRSDEQKRQLAASVIAAVRKATGEPLSNMVFVVHEDAGVNFCEAEKYGDQRVKVALRKAQRHRSTKALLSGSAPLRLLFCPA